MISYSFYEIVLTNGAVIKSFKKKFSTLIYITNIILHNCTNIVYMLLFKSSDS